MLDSEAVRGLLVEAGAEQHGHFTLTSGNHADMYIDKDSVSVDTRIMSLLAREVAERFKISSVEVIVGPAYGAIVAAHVVAQHMNMRRGQADQVKPVFAVKNKDGGFEIRSTMIRHVRGRQCLVMEDILTTGGSARRTIEATFQAGAASVVGLAAFCNRGGVTKEALGLAEDAKFETLLQLEGLKVYPPLECPLCQQGIPMSQEFGHGGV